jgi:hypothetical protein
METSTWWEVRLDAESWVEDAVHSGDLDLDDRDMVEQWMHETADGCSHVIYYDNAYGLYRDNECPVPEDENPTGSIANQLTIYAYEAVRYALELAVDKFKEDEDA